MLKILKMRSLVSLLALTGAILTPLAAQAAGVAEASPSGKGIAGGALLGAELVLATEAALDVQPTWAYIVGGVAGGAAGGVGGYFVETSGDARIPMLMLAGGLAFAIPTVVAVLSATAYEPPTDYLQDTAPADEPVAEPPRPSGADGTPTPEAAPPAAEPAPEAPAPATRRQLRPQRRLALKLPPPALVGLGLDRDDTRLALGIPNVELRHTYTRTEQVMFNAPDTTEVRVPLLSVAF